MRTLLWLVALATLSPAAVLAETSRDAATRLGVDIVQIKGGREVRGSLVQHRDGEGLTIAVRRAWLAKRYADWLAELDAAARTEQRAALESVIERTDAELTAHFAAYRAAGAPSLHLCGSGPAAYLLVAERARVVEWRRTFRDAGAEVFDTRTLRRAASVRVEPLEPVDPVDGTSPIEA